MQNSDRKSYIISGPTFNENLKPFTWINQNKSYIGMPSVFNFSWILV